jgi:Carboxypeptidase regulatory-like domain/TonB dependent receptor
VNPIRVVAILMGSLLFVWLCAFNLAAQGVFGTISGTVIDPSGAVVPGATVKVINTGTSVTVALKTNGAGVYNATSLNPGTYKVTAEAKGFKTAIAENILLEVNANPKVDLTLTVGQASETVEVSAGNTAILQTQKTDLGQTLNTRELEQLPTQSGSGRSPYNFLVLAAGVSQQTGCTGSGTGNGGVGACGNSGNVRISGSRPRNDDNILDGISITPPVFGGQDVQPTVEAIGEFRIQQNSMSAEFGKAGGAIVIAETKSGTNQFHGSAYEYNRNQNLDAKDFFVEPGTPKNPLTYDEFGGSIGGPIIKGRLFFFTDYEAIRQHGSQPNATVLVPDAAFRSGDLSSLCRSGFTAGVCNDRSNGSVINQIYFPGTTTPVPNNKIATISPASAALLALWPTSTNVVSPGFAQTTINEPSSNSINRFNPRIDFNLSQRDHIFGVYHGEYSTGISYDIIVGPAGRQVGRGKNYASTLGWTHTFNTTTLNDFRFGFTHRIGDRSPFGVGAESPSAFGISGIPNCLSSVPDTNGGTKCGTPGVSIVGYSSISNGGMLYEPASTLHFSDTLSKLVGRHSLKFGGQADHYSIDNYQPNGVVGNFVFNNKQTGNAFADFLFGAVDTGSNVQVQNTFVSSRAWSYSLFLQDDFKITSKLTLNLGLRWQYDQSFHEIHHGDAFFDPCAIFFSGKDPSCVPHWEQFGVGGTPDTTLDPSKHQFEPRVGFAWNPRGRFVIRGGYGIMHPGYVGHGRAGDGQPGPNLLATTPINATTNGTATSWDTNLPPITSPNPAAITAPIPINANVSFQSWAPRKQYPTYTQLWNFTIEKQFGGNTVAQIGYVGSKGTHLPINYAYNICQQTPASTALEPNPFNFVGPTSTPYCPAAAAAVNAGAGFTAVYCCLTINPGWWGLSTSIYHSMQAQVDHCFSHGFSLLANFTWSKLIDDSSSDWGGFWSLDALGQDFYNRKAERSVSAGDIPARFTLAPIVELPFGPGKKWLNRGAVSSILGGWRVTSIYTISAGTPFGITDNSYGFCNGAGVLEDRPMMVGNPAAISGSRRSPSLWFNNQAFDFSGTCPGSGVVDLTGAGDVTKAFGDAPRFFSNVRNPGVDNLDFSLQKDFKIPLGEQTRLTFSADFFNLPNHAQFAEPNSDPETGYHPATSTGKRATGFGTIGSTSSLPNRTIQLGLHLYF